MRVLILSQYYDPEPVPKAGELARELRDRGHDVEVITGFPNYPAGDLYEGYRLALVQRATLDGIPVRRAYEYPYHGTSAIKRLINYWSFVFSAPLASLFVRRADVMYVWHPPLTVGVAAWLISRLRGIPFVYDVQDIWPESAVLSGMLRPGLVVRLMSRLERFVYARAAHILVVTPGARENLIGKGVAPEKVSAMHHWIDESLFEGGSAADGAAVRAARGWGEQFVALFAGNLGLVQGLDTVVRAAALLRPEDRIRIALMGDGADRARLQALARELGVGEDRLQFVERQPMSAVPPFLAAADALLVHLRRSELSRWVIPTKTLAYLAAGKPVLMAMEGAAADLVSEAGAGVVIPSDDPAQLVDALRNLAALSPAERDAYGQAGRSFLRKNMTRQIVVPQYEEVLRRAARKSA
ncbi:MAG TPA: glycosyltransferase family 4 protein [Thermoanaerobaculia bacterium]|nr:glycosyltransferase family 4 protein [Thermoanaerobaculia bacterium]